MIPLAYFLVLFSFSGNAVEAVIGINWGRNTAQRLIPSQVVDLILQNGITEARVYTSQDDILDAFAGSRIKLTVGIFRISNIKGNEKAWLADRGPSLRRANVSRIMFGNQLFNQAENMQNQDSKSVMQIMNSIPDPNYLNKALDSFEKMLNALKEAGYGDIMLTTGHETQFILKKNITKPSEAEFEDFIKDHMIRFVRMLQASGAPFIIDVFPISRVLERQFDPSFAFPDNKSTTIIRDVNGAVYTNYVEFEYDCIAWALEKINASDLKIVYGKIGWPTDGFPGANASSAERFYKSLLPYLASDRGTPKRPGAPIDAYLHALTDENRMPYTYPHLRHWGIYRSNGRPKFKIDFSGQGRDVFPTLQAINQMPNRWCVFNGDMSEVDKVNYLLDKTCAESDCTSTQAGGSCSGLGFEQNVSYAFNMFFQGMFQDENACNFEGLGRVVLEDPSVGKCLFPVEVVQGEQDNFKPASRVAVEISRGKSINPENVYICFCFFSMFLITLVLEYCISY